MRSLWRWFVGILAFVGIGAIVATVALVMLLREAETPKVTVHEGDYIVFDLDRGIRKQPAGSQVEALSLGRAYVLSDLLAALRRGAADPKVAGVVAHIGGGTALQPAAAQEIAEAVAAFKKVGKKTLLYSESIGGAGGSLSAVDAAAAFQEIWLQPSGTVGISGLALEQPFLRKGLSDYGVRAEIVQRYEYKGAFDFLARDDMAPPVRDNLSAMLQDITASLADDIAANRGIASAAVKTLIERGPLLAPEAKEAKLVDRLGYRNEFDAAVKALFPGKPVDATDYAATREKPQTNVKIALIHATGEIVGGETGFQPLTDRALIAATATAKAIREAAETEGVRAIVLRLDSPGGDYGASDTVRQAVAAARAKNVPVIVSMGDLAASGGYFIASAAETLIAEPTTITGSIGVIGGKIVLEDAWNKLGIHWQTLKTGDTAAMWSPNHGFSPAERARVEAIIDAAYADFTGKVAAARKLSPDAVDKAARGRVFSGRQALALGLVDDTGGFMKALAYAKRAAGIPAEQIPTVVPFPKPKSFTDSLRDLMAGDAEPLMRAVASARGEILPEPLATLKLWSTLDLAHGAAILPPTRFE